MAILTIAMYITIVSENKIKHNHQLIYTIYTAAIKNVVVQVLSDSSVRVSWDSSGLQDITEFVVYYRQASNKKRQTQEMSVVVPSTDNSVIIRNLMNGQEYSFEVVARAARQTVTGSRTGSDQLVKVLTNTASSTHNGCETRE